MRPNFLIFMTDQHRADHVGCYGNSVVQTPNIDALAKSGTTFSRAYVSNPVCMPNRGAIMTSRMSSVHGARGNGIPLPLENITFADLLSEAGYRTALIGKSHLQNMEDSPSRLQPSKSLPGTTPSSLYPEAKPSEGSAGRYAQELRSSWHHLDHHLTLPYYGFQDVILCNHHADECFGDYLRWLKKNHPEKAEKLGRKHGTYDPRFVSPQAWHTQLDEFTYPTHYIAEQTMRWIREHAAAHPETPFALMCSFPDPHHPWTPPGRYWDMYRPEEIFLPPSMAETVEQPRHVQWLIDERSQGKAKLDSPRLFAASAREIKEMIALTYGMITNIDDRIGMVMSALQECQADENTVVIFTADHGDLMGDHGIVLKGPMHYQGLVRVPFIWREPAAIKNQEGTVRDDLVSSIDLPSSILTRAGISMPNGMQGASLFSPKGAPLAMKRDAVLIEESQQSAYLGFEQPVRLRTIITESHRLSVFVEGSWGELYDLQADPFELTNLWDAPEARQVKISMLHRLVQLMMEYAESSPQPSKVA